MRIGIIAIAVSATMVACSGPTATTSPSKEYKPSEQHLTLEQLAWISKQRKEKADAHCTGMTPEQKQKDAECLFLSCPSAPDDQLRDVAQGKGSILGTDQCLIDATYPRPTRRSNRVTTASGTMETYYWGDMSITFVNGKAAETSMPPGSK